MATRTRTSIERGRYEGHNFKIETRFAQMWGGEGLVTERSSGIDIYIDGQPIIPDRQFTKAEQSLDAIRFYVDNLEAKKQNEQTVSAGPRTITIGPHANNLF